MNIKKPHRIILSKKYPDRYFDVGTGEEFPYNEINKHPYWCKREYDNNGNKTYYGNYNGEWQKWEYDQWGHRIYNENSDGYWIIREYDAAGKRIYWEDSSGYIEDNRI